MSIFKYNYVPVEQNQSAKPTILSEGKAKFLIDRFYDTDKEGLPLKTAKDGLPKVNLVFKVTDKDGKTANVWDTFTSNTGWKFHDLGNSIGIPGIYNQNGYLDLSKLLGFRGECMIKIEKSVSGESRNVISKYWPCPEHMMHSLPNAKQDLDDDLPF